MLNGFSNITILIRSKHFERMHAIRKFRGSPTSPPSGATRNGIRFGVDKAFKLRSFWRRPTDFLNIHVAVVGKIVGKLQDGATLSEKNAQNFVMNCDVRFRIFEQRFESKSFAEKRFEKDKFHLK